MEAFKPGQLHKEVLEDGEQLAELKGLFEDVCANGPYTESLDVEEDGRISLDTRPSDSKPPLLPNVFAPELGRPNVETFYRLVQDIQSKLPEFEFNISENPQRTNLTYTVTKRGKR